MLRATCRNTKCIPVAALTCRATDISINYLVVRRLEPGFSSIGPRLIPSWINAKALFHERAMII